MAIYHLHMLTSRLGGRNGRSAMARAAYRTGQALQDLKTGEIRDYTHRQGVEQTFILAPESAPEWVHDREQLWNQVESSETQINSRLDREIDIALPRELDAQQRAELVREDVHTEFVQQGKRQKVCLPSFEGAPCWRR